jgi:hypothetical protein
LDDYSSSYVFIKFSAIFKRKVNSKWKRKQICAEVPGFSSPFSLTKQPSVYYSHESLTLHKTPWTYPKLTRDPWLTGTVTGAKITAARLTGGSRAPAGWSVTSGRSRRSRRCAGRRQRWLGLLWSRAHAAEVVGGSYSGQTTALGFNQSARGAPRGDVEAMLARNREMVQWITWSTCFGGLTNSGERNCTIPVGLVLGSSSGKLQGLLGKLSEGSDRAEVGGIGLVTVVALGRL